jgi:hypothetical protein
MAASFVIFDEFITTAADGSSRTGPLVRIVGIVPINGSFR